MSGSVHIKGGSELPGKGRDLIPAGETLVLETPGGGGIGPVSERPREAVEADLAAGLISRQAATVVYGCSEVSSEDTDEELRFPADSGK
jgi:N-methylhydantoinase B/oxoprolinase/acetone carboxylase alpha subunit